MRYAWMIIFVAFLFFAADFAMKNATPVEVRYHLEWLGVRWSSEGPLFVPIFLTLGWGILFSVGYFFSYHLHLRNQAGRQSQEVKRLKRLVLVERERVKNLEQRNTELQQIAERVQFQLEGNPALPAAPEPSPEAA